MFLFHRAGWYIERGRKGVRFAGTGIGLGPVGRGERVESRVDPGAGGWLRLWEVEVLDWRGEAWRWCWAGRGLGWDNLGDGCRWTVLVGLLLLMMMMIVLS